MTSNLTARLCNCGTCRYAKERCWPKIHFDRVLKPIRLTSLARADVALLWCGQLRWLVFHNFATIPVRAQLLRGQAANTALITGESSP